MKEELKDVKRISIVGGPGTGKTTLAQQLKNFFYKVSGNDTATIAAEDAGIVTVNGTAD